MTGRLREAGPVTWPPLGGDSVVFGSATLGVSVSLARCQRSGGSNGNLVGRGPGGVPDSPRSALLDDSWAWLVRAWRLARLSTLRCPRRAPMSCPPPTTHFSNERPTNSPTNRALGVPTRLFIAPGGEAALGFFTRNRRCPLSPLNLHPRLAVPLSPLIGQFPSRQRPF